MDFIESLKEELKAFGISCSTKRISSSACALVASVMTGGKADYDNNVIRSLSIIAVPLTATSVPQAENQSREIIRIMKDYPSSVLVSEDRWQNSKLTMRARLLAHLGIFRSIYARDCEVRKICRSEADSFLERNHSYGGAKCKYCYGLFLKRVRPKDHPDHFPFSVLQSGALIAAAEFSNARRWNKEGKIIRSYEWIRYASLPELRISGGMGKILKQFINEVEPDDIMSYADLEWSDGEVYRQLGFSLEGHKPSVTFIIDTAQWTRIPILRLTGDQFPENQPNYFEDVRYFQNIGSAKYRLKLTDYDEFSR